MPPAVALLNYWNIREAVQDIHFRGFFPNTGIFRGGVYCRVSLLVITAGRNREATIWEGGGCAAVLFCPLLSFKTWMRAAHGRKRAAKPTHIFILVSYILLAKLYSPHEVHSHCLFMQSGILMLFLFQRKANIAKSRPVLQISDWQTPRPPPPHLLYCWQFMYSIQYVYCTSLVSPRADLRNINS